MGPGGLRRTEALGSGRFLYVRDGNSPGGDNGAVHRRGRIIPRAIGYTIAINRLKWFRSQLAQHRKSKREWIGTKDTYQAELDRLLERVGHYKTLLQRPDYAAKVREAKNRQRRKKRPPARSRRTLVIARDGQEVWDEHLAHLPFMVQRVRRKRFKTMRHLASAYRRPLRWVVEAKMKAIQQGLITEEEWRQSFRQRGRPRTGSPRGPYKKREIA